MYLYTARISRRRSESEGHWRERTSKHAAVVLSHSRISLGGAVCWGKRASVTSALLKYSPPLMTAALRRDTNNNKKTSLVLLFYSLNWCKRVNLASQQPVSWEGQRLQREGEGNNRGVQISQLVLVQWCHLRVKKKKCWVGLSKIRAWSGVSCGGGFNCGAGCTFHSALCQVGSWRCNGGRTTWRTRRRELRGRPWPRNPESWRAAHLQYLGEQERDVRTAAKN